MSDKKLDQKKVAELRTFLEGSKVRHVDNRLMLDSLSQKPSATACSKLYHLASNAFSLEFFVLACTKKQALIYFIKCFKEGEKVPGLSHPYFPFLPE